MTGPGHWRRCTCTTPRLYAAIAGTTARVHPAWAGHPLSRMYCARCATCRGRYTGPWQPDNEPAQ